ncbi:MAG: hypothetical protein DMG21_10400 [Acidobacteria bacterium]|nr:MAG: hypothetical protein DMG21_10400 [Acidobacteriota bacterium]
MARSLSDTCSPKVFCTSRIFSHHLSQVGLPEKSTVNSPAGLPLKDALPELVRFVVIVVVWYLLLRWLYFNPPKKGATGQVFN